MICLLDGMYQLILSDVQWKAMQSTQALSGINVNVKKGPGGRYIIIMDSTQWQQLQVNMKVIYTETIMQQINVQAQPGISHHCDILTPHHLAVLVLSQKISENDECCKINFMQN